MTKRLATLFFAVCFAFVSLNCSIKTAGQGSWEVYCGIRTTQESPEPAKVEIKSSVVDKIVDSLTDGKISPDE